MEHESYVSLEIAKLLKQAGFDWKVRYMYRNNNPTLCICTEAPYRNMPKPNKCPMYWQYAAPTLDVAQRWLREKKGYYVDVTFRELSLDYRPRIHKIVKGTSHMIYLGDIIFSYESAQEAGIKKALEIVLKKG